MAGLDFWNNNYSSGSSKSSGTSAAKQQGKRLSAYADAAQTAGVLTGVGKGKGGKWLGPPDPNAALEAWLNAHDTVSGGSGGGGGGGGGGGWAGYGAAKSNAQARYGEQKAQLDDLYGDYANLVKDNPKATAAAYDALIRDTGNAGKAIAHDAVTQQRSANADRVAGLESLGISPEAVAAAGSQMQEASTEGLNDLAQQNASWQGLQGVLKNAQVARDKLDVQGVQDAKTLAHRQLTQTYEQFMRNLDAQLAASYSGGGGGGGGGSAPTVTNKYRDKFEAAVFEQLLANAGYGKNAQKGPSAPQTQTTTQYKYDMNNNPLGYTVTKKSG